MAMTAVARSAAARQPPWRDLNQPAFTEPVAVHSAESGAAQRSNWAVGLELEEVKVGQVASRSFARTESAPALGVIRAFNRTKRGNQGAMLQAFDAAAYVMTVSALVRHDLASRGKVHT